MYYVKCAISLVISSLLALLVSWQCTVLWRWFCEPSLGAGPSQAAWYGIALIFHGVYVAGTLLSPRDTPDDKTGGWDGWTNRYLSRQFALAFAVFWVMGGSYVLGRIVGWL